MATEITNYQCPNCTGPMHYDGASGKLKCDFCESMFDTAEIEAMYKEKEEKSVEALENSEAKPWIDEGMHAYSCPSCGAELICDETTAATSCPYCGNPSIVPGQMAGALKPDLIIPFKLDKEQAKASLRQHYNNKFFLPKSFSESNHIEDVKGVYVPFWLFDCVAEGEAWFDAGKVVQDNLNKRVTDIYDSVRGGNVAFEKIPTDASVQMPDDMMDSIEPYNYDELTAFSTVYMPGFMADKFDVSQEESIDRFSERAKNTLADLLTDEAKKDFDEVTKTKASIDVTNVKCQYAMLPVWMLATKWDDKNFLFAMNGQTGNFVGDLPCDKKKRAVTAVLTFIISLIVLFMLNAFFELGAFWIFVISAIITGVIINHFNNQLKSVKKAEQAAQYVQRETFVCEKKNDTFVRQDVHYYDND